MDDKRGSVWRKWDLHVHMPEDKLNDGYNSIQGKDVWEDFCDRIEKSDVDVFGLTEYFTIDKYKVFLKKYKEKYPDSKKTFFFNLELRLNETVNRQAEEVNIHLLINPDSLERIDKFLNALETVKTGTDSAPIKCNELKTKSDFESAAVTRAKIIEAFEIVFGKKSLRCEHFLIFTAANNDGIRADAGKKRKETMSDEIDKMSDAFFGGQQNIKYFLQSNRLEDKEQIILKKPVITGSDAHSFEDLNNWSGKRYVKSNEKGEDIVEKDITWIKADTTYEGLKQILYEPEPGERVSIGPNKPDEKNSFQIIRSIKFLNSKDFPEKIEFNNNLCSIIGSRSAGKSALLAYVAHGVDEKLTEKLIPGPGEGDDFKWENVNEKYEIEWANGTNNDTNNGKIIYIPQNDLFIKSKNSEEIKLKIEPILFKYFPKFKANYIRILSEIELVNKKIYSLVDDTFTLLDEIASKEIELHNFGERAAIEAEKKEVETRIIALKNLYKLTDQEIQEYQDLQSTLLQNKERVDIIFTELSIFSHLAQNENYFTEFAISLTPGFDNLSEELKEAIKAECEEISNRSLIKLNQIVIQHINKLNGENEELKRKSDEINGTKSSLIEKYKKNIELDSLVKKSNEHTSKINTIADLEAKIDSKKKELDKSLASLNLKITERAKKYEEVKANLTDENQEALEEIRFDLEIQFKKDEILNVSKKVNKLENSKFVNNNELQILEVLKDPSIFLTSIYYGIQKVNISYDKKQVVKEILTLTENILFVAEMEGDRIGGFLETTMTPGKRALFLLKLILAESDEKWPLLIDQPEDNLDSRSIFDEIVPFLKKKKKERQIIMVSHNANLVIASDSEQIVVANRNGKDRPNKDKKQFNYLTGSIENTCLKDYKYEDTLYAQGIKEHACEILDGGKVAFENRRNKYNIFKNI